ncbi:universal stress protein [Paracoccaceae bacterium GXU_MW_L88]
MTNPNFPMRILVASDGSGPSDTAMLMAGELAEKTGSELYVLHVSLISRYLYPDILSDAQLDRIKAEAQKRLDAEEARARQSGVEIKESFLRLGRPADETMRLAQELDVGIIVIGNRSGEAMRRILLGNDAESIVRHAHCSVLVVREPDPR